MAEDVLRNNAVMELHKVFTLAEATSRAVMGTSCVLSLFAQHVTRKRHLMALFNEILHSG